MEEKKLVGKVTHYYSKIDVAIVELDSEIEHGDEISIEGPTTDIQQVVDSMQAEHKPVMTGRKGDSIGLKVKDKVKSGDHVYRIE